MNDEKEDKPPICTDEVFECLGVAFLGIIAILVGVLTFIIFKELIT